MIRAALAFRNAGYGDPILLGREHRVKEAIDRLGLDGAEDLPITNAKISDHLTEYTDLLYSKLQRRGSLYRDCQRMVNLDRNVFAACMVSCGHADALVTGVTRFSQPTLQHIRRVIDVAKGSKFMYSTSMIILCGRTVFVGDVAEFADLMVKRWLILLWRWLPKPARWAIIRGLPSCHSLILAILNHALA